MAGTKATRNFLGGAFRVQSERDKRSTTKGREKDWDRVVASVISATRQDLDITQEQLADELGWTRDAVSNLENQRRHCKVSDLIRIAKAFGMQPDELIRRITHW
jgi:DNA-binding XRE family transcriptional regulator